MIAETLGDIFKWYDSVDDLINENVRSIFEYTQAAILIHNKISDEDVKKLMHPANKTYGFIFVRWIDGEVDTNSTNFKMPPITEYVFPFNDEAIDIINNYGILELGPSYRTPCITVLDLDHSYKGGNRVEEFDIWDYRSTSTTIRLSLFALSGKYLETMLSRIKNVCDYDLTIAGHVSNDITKAIHSVIDNNPNWKQSIEDILTGRLGVIKLESRW